jgi:Protein of unknown function, DUF488
LTTSRTSGRVAVEAPALSAVEAPGVYTSSYSRFRPEWGVPVGITVALPRWFAHGVEVWQTPAPFGLLDVTDEGEFRRRYRHRLHRLTPKVLGELRDLVETYAPAPLVLLCYEPPGAWCHRVLLAEWLQEKTGLLVPEWEEAPLE